MQFSNIKDLLGNYQKRLFKADDERKIIRECIFNISGVEVQESEMVVKNKTLRLSIDNVSRNNVYIYKQKILDEIVRQIGNSIVDIN